VAAEEVVKANEARLRSLIATGGEKGRASLYPKYGSHPETADAPLPNRPMSDHSARLTGRDQVPEGSGSDRRQDSSNLGAGVGPVARFAQPSRQTGAQALPRHRSAVSAGGASSGPRLTRRKQGEATVEAERKLQLGRRRTMGSGGSGPRGGGDQDPDPTRFNGGSNTSSAHTRLSA
jgi:hypothetical protein